ncbi:hypothetical protein DFH06DRAFT_1206793 [Mycena polygramma]|nr:hypothetical protein DFH06DRAFT_1206793 [Mycena polygramma]
MTTQNPISRFARPILSLSPLPTVTMTSLDLAEIASAAGAKHPPSSPINPLRGPNALQGNALAALMWVAYDLLLTMDREVRAPWSITKCMYLFLRYNSLAALAFYFMETLGTTPFLVMLNLPSDANSITISSTPCLKALKYALAGRSYIAATEILCVLVGEALILLRINALYGWERKWIVLTVFSFMCEAIVGIATTIVTLSGGASGLSGSTGILDCSSAATNVPDVNLGACTSLGVVCIYFAMILRKTHLLAAENAKSMWQILHAADLLPTIHVCLKDACAYFLIGTPYVPSSSSSSSSSSSFLHLSPSLSLSQLLTQITSDSWLISTYTVASTRIFLNLKDLNHRSDAGDATWSEFQQRASVLDFRGAVSVGSAGTGGEREMVQVAHGDV